MTSSRDGGQAFSVLTPDTDRRGAAELSLATAKVLGRNRVAGAEPSAAPEV